MKKSFLLLFGGGAIALVLMLNLSFSADNYGISKNSLPYDVLAQTNTGGGTTTGGSTTSGGNTSAGGGTTTSSGFSFNNQYWDTEDHWYNIIGDWKPKLADCSKTENTGGSASITVLGTGASVSWGGTQTSSSGKMIECQGGSGNCVNGTKCYAE